MFKCTHLKRHADANVKTSWGIDKILQIKWTG